MTESNEGCTYRGSDAHSKTACPMRGSSFCNCNQGRLPCACRDVIGEVIAEDSRPMVSPAVSEHAMLESVPALRAAIAHRDAKIEDLERDMRVLRSTCPDRCEVSGSAVGTAQNYIVELEQELAALKSRPAGGVVMPERKPVDESRVDIDPGEQLNAEWNACLDELARLNAPPVIPTIAGDGVTDDTLAIQGRLDKYRTRSVGGVDERAAFDEWFNGFSLSVRMNGGQMNDAQMFAAWQARATLNAGGAVPDGEYAEVLTPFLAMMEDELHANAGKGDRSGWLQMDRKTALLEIYYHLGKLQKAAKDNDLTGIVEYAADVANMSMMLVDVCGLLAAAPTAQQKEGDV